MRLAPGVASVRPAHRTAVETLEAALAPAAAALAPAPRRFDERRL